MNILTEFFAGEDADGEAEAVFTRGMDLLREAENQEALRKQYGIFKKLRPGADAVECELEDITGKVFKFSDLQGKAVYLDVWATWCGPCQMLAPVLHELADEVGSKAAFYSIDVDENRQLAAEYGISSIPCLVVLKNGQESARSVGFLPKQALQDMLDKYI